jgi:hypothetical protein
MKEVFMFIFRRIFSALLSLLVVLVLFAPSVGVSVAEAKPSCDPIIPFDPGNFSASPEINNQFLPLVPGTQLTLEGTAVHGGGPTDHTVIFTVTGLTKMIDGVNTVVVWDRDFDGSQLAEAELSFFAQDNDGNVWNLAEYPEEYDDEGNFTGAPSTWVAGLDGAEGGIHMLADPKVGTGEYLQGYSEYIDFLDCAKVFKKNQTVHVPTGNYDDVLVTSETSPLDQGGGHQLKYHAPGVGIVQIGAVGDPEAETLAMTKYVHLGKKALAKVNKAALDLDTHGCETNELYSQTC